MEEREELAVWDSDIDLLITSFKFSMVISFVWVLFDILSRIVIQI